MAFRITKLTYISTAGDGKPSFGMRVVIRPHGLSAARASSATIAGPISGPLADNDGELL